MEEITNYISFTDSEVSTSFIVGTLALICFIYCTKSYLQLVSFFKKQHIPYDMPLPFIGNGLKQLTKGLIDCDGDLIRKHGKIVGYFEGTERVILSTDLMFIKAVLIKDFSSFANRTTAKFTESIPPPFNKGLNNIRDEEWRNARLLITPTFTSRKLKEMSKAMSRVSDTFIESLEKLVSTEDKLFDAKKYFGNFTLDVINSCCFGIDTDSLNDPENEFIKNINVCAPKLAMFMIKKKWMNLTPTKTIEYVENYVTQVIQLRKDKKEKKHDFIQHMIDLEDNNVEEKSETEKTNEAEASAKWNNLKKSLTTEEIIGHSLIFLFAGYESTATTLSFISHNLAVNADCQQKLQQEIDEVSEKHNNEISYESVHDMRYLDMVINETLRMYPGVSRLERVAPIDIKASNDYEFNGIKMEKDQKFRVPIWELHHDPELYPDPYKFIPERFDEENKNSRENSAYLPFGTGPRNCVAMRFALVEMKILLAKILSKFSFVKCDQTQNEMLIDKYSGLTRPLKPIITKIERRE